MKNFSQLSPEQRYQLQVLVKTALTQTVMASMLGVDKSTVSRELRRNSHWNPTANSREYMALQAQQKTQYRHRCKPKKIRFSQQMKQRIADRMKTDRLSPELIWAQARCEGWPMVSHETIYTWLWNMKHSGRCSDRPFKKLYRYLKHARRRRSRANLRDNRGRIKGRVCIDKRPAVVDKRKRIGDFEVDLMMGKNHQSALLVMTDRATIKTHLKKVKGKNSKQIANKITSTLRQHQPYLKTITFDNDQAFALHYKIAKSLLAKTFFTHPYTSQDKGTVENRIGVIRRFYPKKTDFNLITHHDIKRVENKINNRPVRKFNYLTPNQLFNRKLKVAFIT